MHKSQHTKKEVSARSDLLSPPDRVHLSRSPHPYRRRLETLHQGHDEEPSLPPDGISRSESNESGTEADDERGPILRGLPAPPLRSHKGLRGSTPAGLSPATSPLPSPPATLQDTLHETIGYFYASKDRDESAPDGLEERGKREAYIRRKKGEIWRRATETILLGATAFLSYLTACRSANITQWHRELILFTAIPPTVYALYPLRKVLLARRPSRNIGDALAKGLHLPSRFDPGPLLYPILLPVIVALSVARQCDASIPVNIVCGLSSFPYTLTAIWNQPAAGSCLRWIVPVFPLHCSGPTSLSQFKTTPFELKTGTSRVTLEDLVLVPPLHDALKSVLQCTTTSSLDPVELELLTTAMLNLLLLGSSPQSQLLTGLLWVGGLSIFVSCRDLLMWEVEIARIPRWRFAKRRTRSIFQRILSALSAFKAGPAPAADSSDDEVDARSRIKPLQRVKTIATPRSAFAPNGMANSTGGYLSPARRTTFPALNSKAKLEAASRARPSNRVQSLAPSPFMTLTIGEARIRKYLYAGAVYILVTVIIALPARAYVSHTALSSYEPFGWAIGYLFGDLPFFHDLITHCQLNGWIPLPAQLPKVSLAEQIFGQDFIPSAIPPGNLRLLLCGYCLVVLMLGIATVLSLTSYVEVDTRRKGFHGVMVLMLLPTIFVDPCFFSLALALILAAFLLLDLFRASQLPPISRPLTNFLAPYVDGRDHRGPVIVSHIFLLIGCAIPLWLSLVNLPRLGTDPCLGWDVAERNLDMVSGVICVGMGDAAASLVGRRYGKTKWYWGGGKSLEGSLAFTVAVTIGLMFAYAWLRVGGWVPWDDSNFPLALMKCIAAGSGASLLESVLTAANDNVVVPIGLWLLVRGLQI